MNKIKHYFKDNRLIRVLSIAIVLFIVYLLLILTINLFNQLDKQHCLNMPFEDLKENSNCDKHWREK